MNNHAKAIQKLVHLEDLNHNQLIELVFKIAEISPASFVQAHTIMYTKSDEDLLRQYITMLSCNYDKIACIKIYKAITNSGLKESKDAIENMCGYNSEQYGNAHSLNDNNVVMQHNYIMWKERNI